VYQFIEHWSVNDRAIFYGDGLFTTMRVADGRVSLLQRHLTRLQQDTKRLGLPAVPENVSAVLQSRAAKLGNGVLKLTLSAGSGGRGYTRPETLNPVIHLSSAAMPATYSDWRKKGITLGISDVRLAKQPLLAGIKHLNRLEQVLVKRGMPKEVDDVLVLDTDKQVIEASSANVFWYSEGKWYTPDLAQSGVAGVMRAHLLDYFSAKGLACQTVSAGVEQVMKCDALFLCNALMGVVPVKQVVVEGEKVNLSIEVVHALAELVEASL